MIAEKIVGFKEQILTSHSVRIQKEKGRRPRKQEVGSQQISIANNNPCSMSLGTEPFLCNVSRERLRTNSRDPQPRPRSRGTSFCERGNKVQKNSKMTNRHQNAVEYIAGKSFLFISFKKK